MCAPKALEHNTKKNCYLQNSIINMYTYVYLCIFMYINRQKKTLTRGIHCSQNDVMCFLEVLRLCTWV
jgi:hypothetical protein